MAGDEPEQEELEAQMEAAMEAIRATVLRLLQEGAGAPAASDPGRDPCCR